MTLTQTKPLTQNILSTYYRSNPQDKINGSNWYNRGHMICKVISNQYNIPLDTVVGVVSALSPNNKWDRNIIDAENMIRAFCYEIDYPKVCTFGKQKDKAIQILECGYDNPKNISKQLNGLKTIAFYRGLATDGKCDEITVDGHAFNIWNGHYTPLNKVKGISPKLYLTIENDYKIASKVINKSEKTSYSPNQIQAITWVCHRRMNGIT